MMTYAAHGSPPRWSARYWIGGSLLLAALNAALLASSWLDQQAGVPDAYPGQHRSLILGSLSGILLSLSLPLPVVLARRPDLTPRRRKLIYLLLAVLLLGSIWTIWLRSR